MAIEFINGAVWQVCGSDNYNSLVGSPPYGVVFSEWPLAKPDAWAYLRPILAENGGWGLFIGTPRGDNHGKTMFDYARNNKDWYCELLHAGKTGVFTEDQLVTEREELIAQYGKTRGEALFQQEYYCSFIEAFQGKVVYPDFSNEWHVSTEPLLPIVQEGIKLGKRKVVRGWDHTGLHPACVCTYLGSNGQWMIFKEFWEPDCSIEEFATIVQTWCGEHLANAEFVDIGDPAGKNRDATKRSPADYIRMHCGIHILDGVQTYRVRVETVAGRLNRSVNGGQPALIVDGVACPIAVAGFAGGYGYKEIGTSGVFRDEPVKDKYADVHDSIQYPATILFGQKKTDQPGAYYPEYVGDE
jgi:hypothetical protein